MKDTTSGTAISEPHATVGAVAFWLSLSLLVFVPLAFSTAVFRTFSLPKFLILLTGAVALAPLIVLIGAGAARRYASGPGSSLLLLVSAYVGLMALSTPFGAAPVASLFGSFENQMGLVTRICFYICFLALTSGIGRSWTRLIQTLWGISLTGLCVATYAFAQFFGRDPFLPTNLYTFNSMGATVVRPIGTLGHADFLGNFLLYTTPVCVGLAFGSSGRSRRFAAVAATVSTAAIAFSGTRGAWLGFIVGAAVFATLERPRKSEDLRWRRPVTIACFVALASALLIASNPASRNIALRARLVVTEGFTGAGRTLLWRDSLRMATQFPIVGCGPEGFRKAFLAYKSDELARQAPDINNESSHDSYLDAAISFGLAGAGFYAAIVASAVSLFRSARRRADRRRRAIITGMLSAFVAATVHNLFIFDQIPTGLYFFGFLALACVAANLADTEKQSVPLDSKHGEHRAESRTAKDLTSAKKPAAFAIAAGGAAMLVFASYSFRAMNADNQLIKAFTAANEGRVDQVLSSVDSATRSFDPAGDRSFAAARALTLCAEKVHAFRESNAGIDDGLARSRTAAIEAAMAHARRSLKHTLTPDSNYLLLAYLASLSGDVPGLRSFAAQAINWDPRFANSRLLMAEAYLAEGDSEQAAREAESALQFNPSLRQAKIILARARGESEPGRPPVEESIERARRFINAGKPARAEKILRRAIARSGAGCTECHRLLASIYEAASLYENAIAEWRIFLTQAPDRESQQAAAARMDALRQRKSAEK